MSREKGWSDGSVVRVLATQAEALCLNPQHACKGCMHICVCNSETAKPESAGPQRPSGKAGLAQ